MEVMKESSLIERAVTFRNRMDGTNCSVEDIMMISFPTRRK